MSLGLLLTIGTQFATAAINSKQSSKHLKKIQALQQEYEESIQKEGIQRAWDSYKQLCTLQKEIEKEQHQRRLDNIEQSFNRYIDNAVYAQALKNWPLRVLPFVMKDESIYCNSSNNSNKKIALHCLLTRSNDDNFNKAIYRELDTRLNQYFNQFWSTTSTHPVLYYSGAWKEMHDASAVTDNLYNQLEQLPTIVISPWIEENNEFYFKISVWGIPNVEMKNTIYKPDGISLAFEQKKEYSKDEAKIIVNNLSPVIVAFVGYIADQYYWRFYNITPLLPLLINNNVISLSNNNSNNFKQQYIDLLDNYISDSDCMFVRPELSIALCKKLDVEINKREYFQKIFITYCQRYNKEISSMEEATQFNSFTKIDLPFLKTFIQEYRYDDYRGRIEDEIDFLLPLDFDYGILKMTDIIKLKTLADAENAVAMFRLGEIYEYSIGVNFNFDFAIKCYNEALENKFILSLVKEKIKNNDTLSQMDKLSITFMANIGVEQAIFCLSEIYFHGISERKDIDKAVVYLNEVNGSSHPYYYYLASVILMEGVGSEEKKAIFKLLKYSADLGYVKAQEKMMMLYTVDTFVPNNPQKHFHYASMAAKQGSLSGITRMGYCFAKGFGVEQSYERALNILAIAVKRNYPDAIKLTNIIEKNKYGQQ